METQTPADVCREVNTQKSNTTISRQISVDLPLPNLAFNIVLNWFALLHTDKLYEDERRTAKAIVEQVVRKVS